MQYALRSYMAHGSQPGKMLMSSSLHEGVCKSTRMTAPGRNTPPRRPIHWPDGGLDGLWHDRGCLASGRNDIACACVRAFAPVRIPTSSRDS